MTEAGLSKLLLWLSPSFPVGGFAYSQGLEWAVERGWVSDEGDLSDWLRSSLASGPLRTELALLSLALRAADDDLPGVAELAAAYQPSRERREEALALGANFAEAYRAAWAPTPSAFERLDAAPTLPVAVALAARDHGLPVAETLEAFALAQIANQISAAIRLGVIGQIAGQRISAVLHAEAGRAIQPVRFATEDDLGGAAFAADIASMRHETQTVRLFRS